MDTVPVDSLIATDTRSPVSDDLNQGHERCDTESPIGPCDTRPNQVRVGLPCSFPEVDNLRRVSFDQLLLVGPTLPHFAVSPTRPDFRAASRSLRCWPSHRCHQLETTALRQPPPSRY